MKSRRTALTCGPFGESGTYTSASWHVYHGTRGPFGANFTSATTQNTIGNSNYNALEVTLRHTSGNLQLLAASTFSKSIDQSSSLAEQINPVNYSLTRAPSAFNIPQNFIVSLRYEIPMEQLTRHSNEWTSGWAISDISRFSNGFPVTMFNNGDTSLLGTQPNGVNNFGVDLPDYTPGNLHLNHHPQNGSPYFNIALFSVPPLGSYGTSPRRFFYGPGQEDFDIALLKDTRLGSDRSLELRLETFNIFNHSQFFGAGSVNGVIGTPGFGSVVSAGNHRLAQVAARFSF